MDKLKEKISYAWNNVDKIALKWSSRASQVFDDKKTP
jgi:hypothetical protein